jgi:3-hydroxyacyl-[acyl-carrier-protein] dehydratase
MASKVSADIQVTQTEQGTVIDQIKQLIPHRYPMLLIDRLINVVDGESAIGIKCVSSSDPYFQGHFPEKAVMPGVLIIEAMAQTAAAIVVYSLGKTAEGKIVYFMSIEEARFRKPVAPGDLLELKVVKHHQRGNVWKFKGEATVNGVIHAEAIYTAMITDQA